MFTNFELRQHAEELAKRKQAHSALSAAYLRLRELIPGALDTPTAPSAQEIWSITENALKNLLARVEIREEAKQGQGD